MSDPGRLCVGLSMSATWLSGEAWRSPDSRVEDLFTARYATSLAQQAEAQKVDFLFRPDALVLNTEGGGQPGFSSLDPTVQLAAIAPATRAIGLVTTMSTTFYPPFIAARQLESLNWLSGGRAGWNVVTALDGNRNFGLAQMPPAEERYARAREFVDVVQGLWRSYPRDALTLDRERGQYANPAQISPLEHDGPHYRVQGPLNLPAFGSPMPLFQAGASATGRAFAASIADGVFASLPDKQAGIELRRDLQARAVALGRQARDVRVLPGMQLTLAGTLADAQEQHHATQGAESRARALRLLQANLGLDLTGWPDDGQVTPGVLPIMTAPPRSETHAALVRRLIAERRPTVAELLQAPEVCGSGHWQVIGTPADAAQAIADWQDAGALDGFIALPRTPGSLALFFDEVMPLLREMGRVRREYSGPTLRDHLTQH